MSEEVMVMDEYTAERPYRVFSCDRRVTRRTLIMSAAFFAAGLILYVLYREWKATAILWVMSVCFAWYTWQDKGNVIELYSDRIIQHRGSGCFAKCITIKWEDAVRLVEASGLTAPSNTFFLETREGKEHIIIDSTLTNFVELLKICKRSTHRLELKIRSARIMSAVEWV